MALARQSEMTLRQQLRRFSRSKRHEEIAPDRLDGERRAGRREERADLLFAIKKKIAAVAVAPLPLPSQRTAGLGKAEKRPPAHDVEHAIDDRARVAHIIHEAHHDRIVERLGQRVTEKIAEREVAA